MDMHDETTDRPILLLSPSTPIITVVNGFSEVLLRLTNTDSKHLFRLDTASAFAEQVDLSTARVSFSATFSSADLVEFYSSSSSIYTCIFASLDANLSLFLLDWSSCLAFFSQCTSSDTVSSSLLSLSNLPCNCSL